MEVKKTELICIGCPLGCNLTVTEEEEGKFIVTGNTCPNGEKYAIREMTDPRRIVTYSVCVTDGELPVVSCKTKDAIPKGKIFDCISELGKIELCAPVAIGDVVCKNVAGTGIDVIATNNVAVFVGG